MDRRKLRFLFLLWSGLCLFVLPVYPQAAQEETLAGPDTHETTGQEKKDHLYAASFIFEPMGYALGNLSTDFETFDPPSTPAAEIRVVPRHNLFVKSMVMAGDNRKSTRLTPVTPISRMPSSA